MKCFVTISLLLTLFSITIAQPVITRGNLMFPGDDIFLNYPEIVPNPGPAGANVIWNFSTVVPDTAELNLHIADAATTPYSTNFPAANIAFVIEELGSGIYQYQLVTNDKWEELGAVTEGFSTRTFDDPETQLQFPLTYNSQWQDEFSYTDEFQVSPISVMAEGSVAAIVDGYGSLGLPHTTFNDVLRVKVIEESMDTSELGQGLSEKNVYHDTTYIWLSPSYHGPLCVYEKKFVERTVYLTTPDTVLVDSETDENTSFYFDPFSGESATLDIQPGKYSLYVSPNPFERILNLEFISDQPTQMQVIIRDMQGNLVYSKSISAQSGENSLSLTLPEIPSGTYIALLKSSDGADVQKLIRIAGSR